jgi:hypothetical protein
MARKRFVSGKCPEGLWCFLSFILMGIGGCFPWNKVVGA